MNYYQHHIGDFNNATLHLDRVERSIYRDLIELYYDTEKPLTLDLVALCRRIRARRDDEPQIVEAILQEFFTETDEGWFHARCEHELSLYRAKAEANRVNGKKGGRPKKTHEEPSGNPQETQSVFSGNPTETQVEPKKTLTSNHKPLTNNHEPIEREQRASRLPADWLPTDEQILFCKATRPELKPQEVAARFRDYWIAQAGQRGRKADWDATWRNWVRNERQQTQPYQSAADKRIAFAEALTGKRRERTDTEIIDLN